MYKRIFKQKGSRVYRVRYRLSDGPKIYDEPLKTHIYEVAEAKARQLIDEREKELVGLIPPRALREASQTSIAQHCADFIADLVERNRGRGHVVHARCRLEKLVKECHWHLLRDVTAESFVRWRARQAKLSPKTLNEYLGHAHALFNWMERHGRATFNPLKPVNKLARKDTFKRRALSADELMRLVASHKKRGFAYLVAACTGLRRGEIKQLLWSDVHLDAPQPFIDVRAETTKSKKAAVIPVIPILDEALRRELAKGVYFCGRVFPRGLPSVRMLTLDLKTCGIPVEDARGFRIDFHALRHTFASLLAAAGVSELARVKLARHSEWRQTDRYTDTQSVPLFAEMEKLAAKLPSSLASQNPGKTSPVMSKFDRPVETNGAQKIVNFRGKTAGLTKAVANSDCINLVPEGGLEPPRG